MLNINHFINLHINVIYLKEVLSEIQPYNNLNLHIHF